MSDYTQDAAFALDMIDSEGGEIIIRGTRQAAAVPSTGRPATPPEKLESSPKAVCLPVAKKYVGADLFGTGTLIRESHRMALIAGPAMTWEPRAGDTVFAEGQPWTVIGMKTLKPDSRTPVLHTLFYTN
jgi:hypothetical protein